MSKPRKNSRRLTKTQLRAKYADDRKAGKRLQKMGLLSPRANLNKPKPSLAVRKKIASLSGIFNGTQQAVEVTDVMLPKYKAAGYRTIGRRVVLDKQPRQKFVRRRSEILLQETDTGSGPAVRAFETVLIPVNISSISELAAWIREDPDRFMRLLPPGTAFAFTFHGHNSRQVFSDPLELADYLDLYFAGPDAWQHFVLYRLIHPNMWESGTGTRYNVTNKGKRKRVRSDKRKQYDATYYQYNRAKKLEASKLQYQRAKEALARNK